LQDGLRRHTIYLDWQATNLDYYAIDIEANSLTPTTIWCMCWENIKTKEAGTCRTYEEIRNFFDQTKGSIYVGHNIVKFDAPYLNSLIGLRIGLASLVDTLVLSTLYYPAMSEGHSLEAWGVKMGIPKGVFNDWSRLSEEMVTYCKQDVAVTASLFRRLTKTMRKIGFSEKTCYIQHYITSIIERQRKNGFYFNGEKAINLFRELRAREEQLQGSIRTVFPAEEVLVRSGDIYTKAGDKRAQYDKDCGRYEIRFNDDGRRYEAFEGVEFNIGSPKQRVDKLTALGWVADEFTKTGLPKATEKSLIAFAEETGIPEVALITKWLAINGRANMINTWLDNYDESDSCIHGKLFVADTLRFRHNSPNTANIPAVRIKEIKDEKGVVLSKEVLLGERGYFTYEARDLWCARPGRVLVGTDAAGLELRMLAHYLNRESFTKQVLDGDPHQYNADLAGVSRPTAKTLLYAIQYGAQAGKVASIIEGTKAEGAVMRQTFLDRLGLTEVMNGAISEQGAGRVFLCDGAGLVCPSPHSALNYKLQGSGARVMAQAAIILDGHLRRSGLDCLKVGDIHDEWQYDCEPSDAEEHRRLSVQSIVEAGEELNLNIPLDGTAKKGLTWAETH
jgi:DNA polymerase I